MKLGFTTLSCPDWDLQNIITAAKQYGYDGVDLRGYLREMAIYKRPEFSQDLDRTAEMFAKAGIEISGLSSGARLYETEPDKRQAALDEVRAYAELCEKLGVKIIRVFGGRLGQTPPDQALPVARETLLQMAEIAEPALIVVETHDDWVDSSLLGRLLETTDAPNVAALWDLHHPYRLNGEKPEQTTERIGRFVRYVHVKDSKLNEDASHTYTLPGQGDVPIDRMIELLAAGGYDGWLVVEWEKLWRPQLAEPDVALPAYAQYLRKLI